MRGWGTKIKQTSSYAELSTGDAKSPLLPKNIKERKMKSAKKLFVLLPSLLFVAACGSSSNDTPASEPTTAITGSIFAGPVNGARVTVKNTSGATVAGPVTTGSDGTYSINIPNTSLSGDLIVESSGGAFTDEATGTAGVTAGTFSAHISGGTLSAGGAVHVTPYTTIVQP